MLRDARRSRQNASAESRTAIADMLISYNRADDGLRTRDLQLGKLALYQLSYVRVREDFIMPGVALSST
jgi:hypothetical protein